MIKIILIYISSLLFCQDHIDILIEDVLNGSKDSASVYLSSLEMKYPNNPNMLFLKGLMTLNGNDAKQIFIDLYNNHPTSKYGDDAVMKVAEFYYASGLYIQSSNWLKKMPLYYSRSEHIERAIKLFLNSLIVSGNRDTAIFYSNVLKRQFPNIDIDGKMNDLINDYDKSEKILYHDDKKNTFIKESVQAQKANSNLDDFSLQSGAFSSRENAKKQMNYLKDKGYNVRISELLHEKKTLFAVRIGHYPNKEKAKIISKKIKSSLDIHTIVIKNE